MLKRRCTPSRPKRECEPQVSWRGSGCAPACRPSSARSAAWRAAGRVWPGSSHVRRCGWCCRARTHPRRRESTGSKRDSGRNRSGRTRPAKPRLLCLSAYVFRASAEYGETGDRAWWAHRHESRIHAPRHNGKRKGLPPQQHPQSQRREHQRRDPTPPCAPAGASRALRRNRPPARSRAACPRWCQ